MPLSPRAPALLCSSSCTHSGELSLLKHMDVNSGHFPGRERSQMLQAALPSSHPQSSPARMVAECHCALPLPSAPAWGSLWCVRHISACVTLPFHSSQVSHWPPTSGQTVPFLQPTLTGSCLPHFPASALESPLSHTHMSCEGHRAPPGCQMLGLSGTGCVPLGGQQGWLQPGRGR